MNPCDEIDSMCFARNPNPELNLNRENRLGTKKQSKPASSRKRWDSLTPQKTLHHNDFKRRYHEQSRSWNEDHATVL
jgi:hypothetical protein